MLMSNINFISIVTVQDWCSSKWVCWMKLSWDGFNVYTDKILVIIREDHGNDECCNGMTNWWALCIIDAIDSLRVEEELLLSSQECLGLVHWLSTVSHWNFTYSNLNQFFL